MVNIFENSNIDFGVKHTGKVRDTYINGDYTLLVTTDRQSGFDRHLCSVLNKSKVLTETSLYWFEKTKHIINNHVIKQISDESILCQKCDVLPIEFVVRGYLTGSTKTSIWTVYQNGERDYCGIELEDGMVKNQKLSKNVCTPTTKEKDTDRPITAKDIVKEGWLSQEQWDFCSKKALELFEFGQQHAGENGLILVDTKYEFGVNRDGEIILIDEIHTPDSSRYWLLETYDQRMKEGVDPDNFDKEFIRKWFKENCDPYQDEKLPTPPKNIIDILVQKYIDVYEILLGKKFIPNEINNKDLEITKNLHNFLESR